MNEIPLALSLTLAQHPKALRVFDSMNDASKQSVISRSMSITTKEEMDALVTGLLKYNLH